MNFSYMGGILREFGETLKDFSHMGKTLREFRPDWRNSFFFFFFYLKNPLDRGSPIYAKFSIHFRQNGRNSLENFAHLDKTRSSDDIFWQKTSKWSISTSKLCWMWKIRDLWLEKNCLETEKWREKMNFFTLLL